MRSKLSFRLAAFATVLFIALKTNAAAPEEGLIDDCRYTSDANAAAAWHPMQGSQAAATGTFEGSKALRLVCDFKDGKIPRGSWDYSVKLDLSRSGGLQFDVLCSNTLPISYFNLYLQSGTGWYSAIFYPETAGWNTISLDKSQFKTEGNTDGWDKIKAVRISAWRQNNIDTEFAIRDLRMTPPLPAPGTAEAASNAIAKIGLVASYKNFTQAMSDLSYSATNFRSSNALHNVAAMDRSAAKAFYQGDFKKAENFAARGRNELIKAYCLAHASEETNELRAFWCHSAFGVPGTSWDEAIRQLAAHGFNTIIPNMLSAGVAYYDSKVLPVSPKVAKSGDQIRECLAACRKYGVQIHVWKLNWNLNGASKEFLNEMRKENRLQKSVDGKEELWLCPSNPKNQELEIAAMTELVRDYDIDGIHFDYIRYPGINFCFCDACKERFQKANDLTLKTWPADVLADGQYRQQWLDWRRSNITAVVKAISEQSRAIKPKIKLSAAVFRYWNTDRDEVGQDWKLWCDRGYLDFICPMDYTASNLRFDNMVSQQVGWAGHVPVYPGIGAMSSSSRFGADRTMEEIEITRKYKTHGFVIFSYNKESMNDLMPMLGFDGIGK